jgi:hypothetical protein
MSNITCGPLTIAWKQLFGKRGCFRLLIRVRGSHIDLFELNRERLYHRKPQLVTRVRPSQEENKLLDEVVSRLPRALAAVQ